MGDGRWKCFKSFYIKSRADRFCDDIFERGAVLKLTIDINWFNKCFSEGCLSNMQGLLYEKIVGV